MCSILLPRRVRVLRGEGYVRLFLKLITHIHSVAKDRDELLKEMGSNRLFHMARKLLCSWISHIISSLITCKSWA
ncbi:hypothetical protein KP509_24G077400 [Ceratopteris richardii]|nr:hypothetical protein KP509_24G077400 [Ceratopteris richardii]